MLKDAQQGGLVSIEELAEEEGEIDELTKHERAVLKELFTSCGGAAWRKSSSWNTEEVS